MAADEGGAAAAPARRFCAQCNCELPVSHFRKSPKFKLCRAHETKKYREHFREHMDPAKRFAYKILHRVAVDAQRCFRTKPALPTAAIVALGLSPDQMIVPCIPTEPITPSNCLVVDSLIRTVLMRAWSSKRDPAAYAHLVEKLGLSQPAIAAG